MLFNSFHFLIFFPVVVILQFLLPQRLQLVWLVLASCYFYMALIPVYILVLFALILVDFGAGIAIENARGRRRKFFLVISLIANISVLGFFKYFNFFNGNAAALAQALHLPYSLHNLDFVLPIGLSFHTFQSMAYTVEVYRRRWPAERNLLKYALYVLFWPQLVAGPIERPQNLLPQFARRHGFDYDRVVDGLRLMLIGFFKKCVIADRLTMVVDPVYSRPDSYHGAALLLATYAFAFQIYYDFSGYTDIALGAARVSGFRLMQNFRQPYLASSVSEFWQRWHISLSTWFRDYLYIPLGGSRVPRPRHFFNLLVVFAVSGFWHGAQWTYLAWGTLHGIFLVGAIATQSWRDRLTEVLGLNRFPRLLFGVRVFCTFNLVSFAWIFFRATSLSSALLIVGRICAFGLAGVGSIGAYNFGIAIAGMSVLALLHFGRPGRLDGSVLAFESATARFMNYCFLSLVILIFGRLYMQQSFIYFQF